MRLPFDNDSVKEDLAGKPVVLLKNDSGSSFFDVVLETRLESVGEVTGIGNWGTQDGALRLLDKRGGLAYEFRGIETRNGCVYAVGRNVLEMPVDGMRRVILYPKVSPTSIGVCVSSHVEYEEIALPKLLKSLELDGFDMKKVLVVVGGDKKDSKAFDTRFNVNIVRRKKNALGFTALCNVDEFAENQYWLLLHDTCDVVKGFSQNILSVDVGLNPDIVLIGQPKEYSEIAIYSSAFIKDNSGFTSDVKPSGYFPGMVAKARTVVVLNVPMKKEPPKDIYGTGVKRETIVLQSLGIRKFRGRNMSGGKP
jgi:hypothetical protein